jgi:CRP/FNR family cyclic AMP-dependent transcriptional regulator
METDCKLIESFLGYCHQRRYPARTEILRPGDPADTLCYIVEGSISIQIDDERGQEIVLAYLHTGDFLGEVGVFMTLETRNVYARSRSATVLAEISYQRLQELLDRELARYKSDFLMRIGTHISQRLMKAERKLGDLGLLDVTGRIARALLDLAQEPDARTHAEGIRVQVTRTEMARIAGCSRETAGRCLKEMENRGLIITEGRTVIVKHRGPNASLALRSLRGRQTDPISEG